MKPKALLSLSSLVCFLIVFTLASSPARAASFSIMGGGEAAGMFAVIAILGLAAFAFWIWMLVDCLTSKRLDSNDRLLWVLLIVFLGVLGAILYFFIKKNK